MMKTVETEYRDEPFTKCYGHKKSPITNYDISICKTLRLVQTMMINCNCYPNFFDDNEDTFATSKYGKVWSQELVFWYVFEISWEIFCWNFFTIVCSLWKNWFRFELKVKDQFRKLRQRIQNKTYPVCNFGDHATCISYTMRNQPKAVQFSTGCLPSCHSREKRIDTIVVIRLKFKNNILLVSLTEIFLYNILYII